MSGDMFLDKFFRVNQEIELPDGEKVVMRVLSDVETQQAADYSVRTQAEALSKLRDVTSMEYVERVAPVLAAPSEVLVDLIINAKRLDFVREARDLYPIDFYPYPKDATSEEKAEVMLRQAKHEADVFKAQMQYVTSAEETVRKKLEGLEHDALASMAVNATINYIAVQKRYEEDSAITLTMAIERIGGGRYWTIDEVHSLPRKVQDTLLLKYREVDSIDPWELTKSLQARNAAGVDTVHPNGDGAGEPATST